ncbi:MAG: uracil-DNA glycosylase [Actinomycetia bacterium]|nr:uracil-DNA glycosylase [Actinomycetes bacterium]
MDAQRLGSRAAYDAAVPDTLPELESEITACRACPRLVAWREAVAADPPARFRGETYWARPVPGFGDPHARVAIVGLAPAANGANRTGRMFTGDRSGDFLFAALHRTGFASQPTSVHAGDGLELHDAFITAAVRCAPPDNKPTPGERTNCLPWVERELDLLTAVQVFVVLGAFAYHALWTVLGARGVQLPRPRPAFAHGLEVPTSAGVIVGSFHPSQQNTFTRRLTPPMLDSVFLRARALAALPEPD